MFLVYALGMAAWLLAMLATGFAVGSMMHAITFGVHPKVVFRRLPGEFRKFAASVWRWGVWMWQGWFEKEPRRYGR